MEEELKDTEITECESGKKQNNEHKGLIKSLIAVICILGLGLIVSVTYNFLGGFYYCRVISFDKMLGEEQTIMVDGVGSFSCGANFSGSLVVGGDIKQPLNVLIGSVENSVYLRAKFKINGLDYNSGYMFGYANWINAEDGYIYFNQPIYAQQTVGLCTTLRINAQMDLKSSTDYIAIFTVEASEQRWKYVAV